MFISLHAQSLHTSFFNCWHIVPLDAAGKLQAHAGLSTHATCSASLLCAGALGARACKEAAAAGPTERYLPAPLCSMAVLRRTKANDVAGAASGARSAFAQLRKQRMPAALCCICIGVEHNASAGFKRMQGKTTCHLGSVADKCCLCPQQKALFLARAIGRLAEAERRAATN